MMKKTTHSQELDRKTDDVDANDMLGMRAI